MYKNTEPKVVYLKDYTEPHYWIDSIDLTFHLDKKINADLVTEVKSVLQMRKNSSKGKEFAPLHLDGEQLTLVEISLDDMPLIESKDYEVSNEALVINRNLPEVFTLKITTHIQPQHNTALTGLYKSKDLFCTQCEAIGFRRITYYLDRSDVMAIFKTTIIADKDACPILLSNGNPIDQGQLENNHHFVTWSDPFKKPCYLFALVAGDLACIEDNFVTQSNRNVKLAFYVEKDAIHQCGHAILALKDAMRFDEEAYGREYDLDIYMVVAVHDFNMGAMENKGLNVFNTKYVLCDPNTATDVDYIGVDAVIGHEYFHNWTGNRITCRDWFQLSLKEGLTVFREQQFSSRISQLYNRICETKLMRNRQFVEDMGPMAHPVRPESYMEINNFYTVTVYDKGAEVIRMMHTLLTPEGFKKGMDLYFDRHDGQAVTCEDFVKAMEDASGVDLKQFRLWYSQKGTPKVKLKLQHNQLNNEEIKVNIETKQCFDVAMQIPMNIQLYNEKGQLLSFREKGRKDFVTSAVIVLTKFDENIELQIKVSNPPSISSKASTDITSSLTVNVIPSFFGDFSAPVKMEYAYSDLEYALLLEHDKNLFNRWDISQKWLIKELSALKAQINPALINAYVRLSEQLKQGLTKSGAIDIENEEGLHLHTSPSDFQSFIALTLELPSVNEVSDCFEQVDMAKLKVAYSSLKKSLAIALEPTLFDVYQTLYAIETCAGTYEFSKEAVARRSLLNATLGYLCAANTQHVALAKTQFTQANNMTLKMGALKAINDTNCDIRDELLATFYNQYKDNLLVICKWLGLIASSQIDNTLSNVMALTTHQAFDWTNPNKVYALIGGFSANNPFVFHQDNGEPYQFLKDCLIKLDKLNPQVAARMAEAFTHHKKLIPSLAEKMKKAIHELNSLPLSVNLKEIIVKSLEA